MKTALITGATSGIGEATARALANNHRLILCGRNNEKLEKLKQELSLQTEVATLKFDVSIKTEVFSAIESLSSDWQSIDVLVNNAGNAHGLETFQEADLDDLEAMIDGNVKGLIYVTKAVLPFVTRQYGIVVNLSSIAGKETYTKGTTYCASKAAVEALSKGMRLDFLPLGIRVINIAPGAVETQFSMVRFKGDKSLADNVYKGFEPLVAEDIAHTIAYAVNQPEHVQLADITIFPKAQASAGTTYKNI